MHAIVVYLSVRLSVCVCVSVILWCCLKTAKRRIMHIMPHDRPGNLVFKWDVLYHSCRISTDKHVARSLCHSRASCYNSSRDVAMATILFRNGLVRSEPTYLWIRWTDFHNLCTIW